jgi:ribosomal protein S18 acetylase RimI-like enzyme
MKPRAGTSAEWKIVPLSEGHDRASFDCGVASLNDFLKRYARQNELRKLSRTYVAIPDGAPRTIAGYYTLSGGAVRAEQVPHEKLPRYPVPTAHLGRLAVDHRFQRKRLGELLLLDALRRCLEISREIGVFAVEVVAVDEPAVNFYRKYGFVALKDNPLHLYIAMKTVEALDLDAD